MCSSRKKEAVSALMALGADTSHKNKKDITPMDMALASGEQDLVLCILGEKLES